MSSHFRLIKQNTTWLGRYRWARVSVESNVRHSHPILGCADGICRRASRSPSQAEAIIHSIKMVMLDTQNPTECYNRSMSHFARLFEWTSRTVGPMRLDTPQKGEARNVEVDEGMQIHTYRSYDYFILLPHLQICAFQNIQSMGQ